MKWYHFLVALYPYFFAGLGLVYFLNDFKVAGWVLIILSALFAFFNLGTSKE